MTNSAHVLNFALSQWVSYPGNYAFGFTQNVSSLRRWERGFMSLNSLIGLDNLSDYEKVSLGFRRYDLKAHFDRGDGNFIQLDR